MTAANEFSDRQLELTSEFGKYLFDHPEIEDAIPDGAYVYFEVDGEPAFNEFSQSQAVKKQQEGVSAVLVRVRGLAPQQGSRLIDPVIEPARAIV